MNRKLLAAVIGILVATAPAGPTVAEQSELSAFLFGRNYNDGIMTIQISPGRIDDERDPSLFLFPVRIRQAQQVVENDPALMDALARRGIALHNVLWVRTAANGGRIIYYR